MASFKKTIFIILILTSVMFFTACISGNKVIENTEVIETFDGVVGETEETLFELESYHDQSALVSIDFSLSNPSIGTENFVTETEDEFILKAGSTYDLCGNLSDKRICIDGKKRREYYTDFQWSKYGIIKDFSSLCSRWM